MEMTMMIGYREALKFTKTVKESKGNIGIQLLVRAEDFYLLNDLCYDEMDEVEFNSFIGSFAIEESLNLYQARKVIECHRTVCNELCDLDNDGVYVIN
jgi:hypothetical protein